MEIAERAWRMLASRAERQGENIATHARRIHADGKRRSHE